MCVMNLILTLYNKRKGTCSQKQFLHGITGDFAVYWYAVVSIQVDFLFYVMKYSIINKYKAQLDDLNQRNRSRYLEHSVVVLVNVA